MKLRVEAHRVTAQLTTGWPARKRVATSFAAPASLRASDGEGSAAETEAWVAGLRELEATASLRGARFDIELANSLVHFDVAAGDFAAQSDRQLQAIAVACMGELLGDAAAAHEVRWSLQADERHLLIAAVPRSCVAPFATVAQRQGARLDSIQPGFCRQWNAYAPVLQADITIFAVALDSHAVVACAAKGSICAISVGQWDAASDATRPMPLATTGALLEERAERLLASLGIERTPAIDFMVLAADPSAFVAPPRWKVMPTERALS